MDKFCKNCGAEMIPGIFPQSQGWCKAECDIKSKKPEPSSWDDEDTNDMGLDVVWGKGAVGSNISTPTT